jgi:hypothetical protein
LWERYEEIRHRIVHFDEMLPEQKQELFDRVWALREDVFAAAEYLPKPAAAALHDALTYAVLFFLQVYAQDSGASEGARAGTIESVEPRGGPMPVRAWLNRLARDREERVIDAKDLPDFIPALRQQETSKDASRVNPREQ